jgi:hypothetical protein
MGDASVGRIEEIHGYLPFVFLLVLFVSRQVAYPRYNLVEYVDFPF